MTSALVRSDWSALRPGERAPDGHWTGGCVGLRTGLDDVERRKILPLLGLELRPLGRPARSQSLYRLRCPRSPTSVSYWQELQSYRMSL
jgi:hypothetical protein